MPVNLTRTRTTSLPASGDQDHDGRADAGDILRHVLVISNNGSTPATGVIVNDPVFANSPLAGSTANGTINISPIAFNDSFTAIGNTTLHVGGASNLPASGPYSSVAGNLMSNDVGSGSIGPGALSADGVPGFQIDAVSNGVSAHGTYQIFSDGSFNYITNAGYEGGDSFTYTIRDAGFDGTYNTADDLTSTATATITTSGQVWYVDASAAGGGSGTSANPFNSLASFAGAGGVDGASDYIYAKGAATGNLTLETGEHLVGTGSALTVSGFTLANAGSNSSLSGSSGYTVTLGSNDEITGITILATGGAGNGGITGSSFGTLTVSNAAINATGQALSLTTGTVAGAGFTSTDSTGGTNNVLLSGVNGTLNLGAGALSGATGKAFDVSTGTANVDYNGSITHTANAVAVSVASKTAGTVSLDGAISSTGSSDGISLASNSGATINFSGKLTIDTSASNSTAFSATGGGTVSATGSGSTIISGQASAVIVQNTNIGASNLSFQSASSSGGTAAGIVLDNTGAAGGLHVTGNGATIGAGGGGVISGKTGADINTQNADGSANITGTTGVGIFLRDTSNVQLNGLHLSNFSNYGVLGSNVNNLAINHTNVDGVNGSNDAVNEGSVWLQQLLGSGSISNSAISGGWEDNLHLLNSSGTLDRLTIDTVSFGANSASFGNEEINAIVIGSATLNLTVQNSSFSGSRSHDLQYTMNGTTPHGDVVVANNSFTGAAGQVAGAAGVYLTTGGNSNPTLTYDINHNTITGMAGNGILIGKGQGTGTLTGTIDHNTVGTVNVSGSGGANGISIVHVGGGTETLTITNNTIREFANDGIYIQAGDNTSGGDANIFATVQGNVVKDGFDGPGGFPNAAFEMNNGTTSSGEAGGDHSIVHLTLGGAGALRNDFATSAGQTVPYSEEIRLRMRFSTATHLPGYSGGTTDDAAVSSFAAGNNIVTAGASSVVTSHGSGSATWLGGPLLASFASPPPDSPVEAPRDGGTNGLLPPADPASGPALVQFDPSPAPLIVDDGILSQAELNLIVGAAIDRWAAAGATADELAAMRAVAFTVDSLPGLVLGSSAIGQVTLDDDAAGFSWFIDATPGDDAEYAGDRGGLRADPGTPAGMRIDLLTTVMHELGHQIGLADSYSAEGRADLMYGTIDPGERRLPESEDVASATGSLAAGLDFSLSPVGLGTLPAGQSVTIVWDSVVTGGYSNQVIPTFADASTIDYQDNGAGAVQHVSSNSETLGPGAGNTVILDSLTLGSLVFNDINRDGIFDGGDIGISGVALTLYADSNGNGVLDGAETGNVIATTTSLAGGAYSFANLAQGDYVVSVDAANFTGAGVLVGKLHVFPGAADPDNNIDNDNNGAVSGGVVISAPIRLDFDSEPNAGAGNDTNNTLDIGVFAPNQAPAVASLQGDSVAYVEGAAPIGIDQTGNATVADSDSADFNGGSLTVSITANGVAGEDVLSIRNQGTGAGQISVSGATISYQNVAIGTFTGGANGNPLVVAFTAAAATPAAAQALLHNILYQDTNMIDPSTASRTITFTLDDGDGSLAGGASSATVTAAVNVTSQNDAPTGSFGGANPTFTEDGAPQAIFTASSISTVEAGQNIKGFTFTLSNPTNGANEIIAFDGSSIALTNGNSVTTAGNGFDVSVVVGGGGSATITVSKAAGVPPATFQTLLANMTYSNTSQNPNTADRIATLTSLTDTGGTAGGGSDTATLNTSSFIHVNAVNDAPVLAGAGNTVTFTGSTLASLSNAITVTDVDSTFFPTAKVTISAGAQPGDTLTFTNQNGITGSYNATTHVLTLSGSATASTYQDALRSVGFSNTTNNDPTNSGADPTRTISWTVDDGEAANHLSNPVTSTVNIADINDAPTGTFAGANPTFTEDGAPQAIFTASSISTVEAGQNIKGFTFTLSNPTNGANEIIAFDGSSIALTNGNSVTTAGNGFDVSVVVGGGGSATITVSKAAGVPPATFQTLLANMTYSNTSQNPNTADRIATLTSLTDTGGTDNGGHDTTTLNTASFIHVNAANDAPVLVAGNTATFTEQTSLASLSSTITVTDPDSTFFPTAKVTISAGAQPGDTLTFTDQNGITGSYNATTHVLTLSGSATASTYQDALRSVGFSNTTNDDPTNSGANPTRTISWTIDDGEAANHLSNTATSTVNVVGVDDPPVAVADAANLAENATISIAVTGNDTDIDGGPKAVVSVNGTGLSAGQSVTLGSGAKVTLNNDGTLGYDPNHAFDQLTSTAGGETGAVNTSASDSFTYALNGGSSTTVSVTVNGVASAEDHLNGSAGNNTITGTGNGDFFDLSQGGNDNATGLGGNDVFLFGATLTPADVVDGGSGTDQVAIQGNYALTLGTGIVGIESLAILPGNDTRFGDPGTNLYSYDLTTVDQNVASGVQMVVDASRLRAGENFTFNGAAETDGSFFIYGGVGVDHLTGGDKNDVFLFGMDTSNNLRWGASDQITGGAGTDQLGLRGDYSAQVNFGATQLISIESIGLVSAHDTRFGPLGAHYSYNLHMNDGNVAAGQQMTVDGTTLRADEILTFDGSAEQDGSFRVFGGTGNDVIIGSAGNDILSGGLGADMLTGNGGTDTFLYRSTAESTHASSDTIQDFTLGDIIDLTQIDADTILGGDQAFSFIGTGAFDGLHPGELRIENTGGSTWLVQGDTNGDSVADFEMIVTLHDAHPIASTDFHL